MPPDPIYAPGSAYHRQRRWTQQHAVRCLETAVDVLWLPTSLVDFGCGEGVLVQWARQHGIDAMGVDLAVPDDVPTLVRADLTERVDLGRTFCWVLCWEVAEHLPASAAETLVDTLVRHMHPMGRILFTAAGPGQRGPGHIHCAAPAFWQRLFLTRGLTYAAGLSSELRRRWLECSPATPWYGKNCQLYWRVG
jgi:hypothetical protein